MDHDPKTPPQAPRREGGVEQPAPKPADETGMVGEGAADSETDRRVEGGHQRADARQGGMLGQG